MKKTTWLLVGLLCPAAALGADAPGPDWAFLTPDANAPAPGAAAPASPQAAAGAPQIVVAGKGAGVQACNSCHTPSGMGQPESANLRGQNADYLMRQMADFKAAMRSSPLFDHSVIAKALTDAEAKQIADYYAGLKPEKWVRIVEAATTPKTIVGRDHHRTKLPGNDTEPLGKRIVEFAENPAAIAQMSGPAFVAYVPPGSVAAGKAVVEGSKSEECAGCHGNGLLGADDIPHIAGLSPTYIARQLYSFKNGLRKGGYADVMKDIVSKLNDDDIIAAASYVSNLNP